MIAHDVGLIGLLVTIAAPELKAKNPPVTISSPESQLAVPVVT
jgi:hypothetical protein